MWRLVLLIPMLLGCATDRVAPAYTAHDWRLIAINTVPFPGEVTMDIRPTGLVYGRMPCNRFAGVLSRWPQGWEFGPIGLRNAPCPAGNAEAAFIAALTQATRAEVIGARLYLFGPNHLLMQFDRVQE